MSDIKSILITGGTGKVGYQLVKHFVDKDYNVIFTSRSQEKISSILAEFGNKPSLIGIPVDLEEPDSSQKVLEFLNSRNIKPDTLINNARNMDYLKINPDGVTQRPCWNGELLMDVVVPYELSMALAMDKDSNLTNIINISSMYGIVPPNPNLYENFEMESPIQYGVAKAALIHLTKELSIRLTCKGIRANSISYGGIEGRVDENFKAKYAKLCPMGRMLKEEEVTGAVDFLVSDLSAGINGHNIVVDGGWSIW